MAYGAVVLFLAIGLLAIGLLAAVVLLVWYVVIRAIDYKRGRLLE